VVNNQLSLEVSNNASQKILVVYDTSFYYQDENVQNYLLEVLPVNKEKWVTFNVTKGFHVVLNSSNLKYNKVSDYDGLIDLPDGIYEFRQSYTPNIETVAHYYHLRTTKLANKLTSEMVKLIGDKCSLSRQEFYRHRDRLRDIDEYIKAAKWMVEECGCDERERGKELYLFAQKQLEQYTNECQC